jgi:hypothetical protein
MWVLVVYGTVLHIPLEPICSVCKKIGLFCMRFTQHFLNFFKSDEGMAALTDPAAPAAWINRGYVSLHPDDVFVYPRELFEVDPERFSPAPPCRDWGLQDPTSLTEGISMMDYMMAKMKMQKLYLKHKTPFEQYAAVLAKRKLVAIESAEVQEAMHCTLRLLGRNIENSQPHALLYFCCICYDIQFR